MRSSLPSSVKVCVPKRAVFVQGRRKRAQKQPKEERRKWNAFWGNKEKDDKKNKAVVDPLLKKLKGSVNEIETEEELNENLFEMVRVFCLSVSKMGTRLGKA